MKIRHLRKNSSALIFSICFLTVTILFSACMGVKSGATKGKKNLYETFYTGDEGMQYFIKPLELTSASKENNMAVDFTFRHKEHKGTAATLNYSLFSSEVIKEITSFTINVGSKTYNAAVNELFYNERAKKHFTSRFSTSIPFDILSAMFETQSWNIQIAYNGRKYTFTPTKKSQKTIQTISTNLFVLF